MRWTSVLSLAGALDDALDEVIAGVRTGLGGRDPDLLAVFASAGHSGAAPRAPAVLRDAFPRAALIGCSAGGVVGAGREVEEHVALSVTAAVLPGVDCETFHLPPDDVTAAPALADRWRAGATCAILLPDPFTCDAERALRAVEGALPGTVLVGGLASGGRGPGDSVLLLDDTSHRAGLVGVVLGGAVVMDTVVAQGCRPIGEPMFVTRAEGNILLELDGRRAAAVLRDLYAAAGPRDRALFRHSLFVGLVMRERREAYQQGDFLVRNLLGIDPDRGGLGVGAALRVGMVVQFHLRDASTSAADLEAVLGRYREQTPAPPAGALVFSCLGRGAHLYGVANHDADAFRQCLGDVPLGGFFCNGEIGPVHGRTFLHGYTSAFGLFRPRR